jgi:SAM-dependent methyltransferase
VARPRPDYDPARRFPLVRARGRTDHGGRIMAFSAACERNKEPIAAQLRIYLSGAGRVLEIGSGTGQHAVYFATELPHRVWQTTERPPLPGDLAARLAEAGLPNLPRPLPLDVCDERWPDGGEDAVFTANTLHIMGWPAVGTLFASVGRRLPADGLFLCYGPFVRHGVHTSPSNAIFDAELRCRDPASGLRDVDELVRLAGAAGLRLAADIGLPAHNELLVWQRTGA